MKIFINEIMMLMKLAMWTNNSNLPFYCNCQEKHFLKGILVKNTLHKIPGFHLISWCGSFMERHSFRRVSGHSANTLRKLWFSTKFPHQEIRLNITFYAVKVTVSWSEVNLEPCQTSVMETLCENSKQLKAVTHFLEKSSIIDLWLGSKDTSDDHPC